MIVPQARLLWWVGLVAVPCAGAAAAVGGPTRVMALIVIGTLVVAALLDAVWGYGSLDGIGVELPAVVRFAKDREGELDVRVHNPGHQRRVVRLGLPFPPPIEMTSEDLVAELPAETEHSLLKWRCTPRKRGRYRLETCYLEGASPFGFWGVRTKVPVAAELRVYPNLAGERRNLAGLFLHRTTHGLHAQRQVGKGRDFEKLREYIPGDSFEDIHWKATAKRGHPITKVYQVERTQEVYVIIDASRLSAREVANNTGDGTVTTLDRFMTAALVMGLVAEQQGDLFGVVTFSNRVQRFLRARNGSAHYGACRDALYTLEPQLVNPDFDELCTTLRLRLRHRALLVFLTSLDDPVVTESFLRNVELIRRQHLVLVNVLRTPGAQPVFADDTVASVDDVYRQLGGHLLWHDRRELERQLYHRGVQMAQLENEKLCVQMVADYLRVKQRQLL